MGNKASVGREHFHALKEAKEDLQGFLLIDRDDKPLEKGKDLTEYMWNDICRAPAK